MKCKVIRVLEEPLTSCELQRSLDSWLYENPDVDLVQVSQTSVVKKGVSGDKIAITLVLFYKCAPR